ncbi:MAG TPA: hypothetical protein VHC39_12835 [Rhizomicrobium sp.]|nr:hypothetical protein [Rhizomicrobium sp.]
MAIFRALLRVAMRTALVSALAAVFGGAVAKMFLARLEVVLKTAIDCGILAGFAYLRQSRAVAEAMACIRGRKNEKSPAG